MNHEPGMAAPAPGSWTMSAPRMQPVDHQDGMIAAPTAEGVPQNGGEFCDSNLEIIPHTSLHYSLTVSKPFKPICIYNMAYGNKHPGRDAGGAHGRGGSPDW